MYLKKGKIIYLENVSPEIEKNITSPPSVSAATIKPSRSFMFLVPVASAKSSKYLKK